MMRHTLFSIIAAVSLCAYPTAAEELQKKAAPVYGITLDALSSSSIDAVTDAIRALPVKPAARVVVDADRKPADFIPLLSRLHEVAYIMLCPCDSEDMKRYKTVKAYTARFADCALYLAPYVDIWEVGNEINGEGWLGGTNALNAQKVYAAWAYLHSRGYKTALTAYCSSRAIRA